MAFHDVYLPIAISYGSRKELSTSVNQFISDSGDVNVQAKQRVLHDFGLTTKIRTAEQAHMLLSFYLCRYGILHTFRHTDILDCTSSFNGIHEPIGTDQDIALVDGQYFLAKAYEAQLPRIIKLPVEGSVIITDDGTDVTSDCTIDYLTGEITGYTPSGEFKAGYRFDVPVRFDSELSLIYVDENAADVSFKLKEVLEDL